MKCIICERETNIENTRLGVCWECATAESIIAEGVDMFDEGLNGQSAKSPADKVKLLIKCGWEHAAMIERH